MLRQLHKLLPQALLTPKNVFFCANESNSNILGDDDASTFYRNAIKRININSSGRGKFT